MCTIKFLEFFFRKIWYLLGNHITMLRKAKETKLRLIQEANKRLLGEQNFSGDISTLRDDNPSPIDLSKINFGRELKKNGYEPLDVDLRVVSRGGNLKRGKDTSWDIKDTNSKGGNKFAGLWISGPSSTPEEAVRKAWKNMAISYYQPGSDTNGMQPLFKVHRDDPDVPQLGITLDSENFINEFGVLQEKDGKFNVILIKPYKLIKRVVKPEPEDSNGID